MNEADIYRHQTPNNTQQQHSIVVVVVCVFFQVPFSLYSAAATCVSVRCIHPRRIQLIQPSEKMFFLQQEKKEEEKRFKTKLFNGLKEAARSYKN
jgi:hypothetical protein